MHRVFGLDLVFTDIQNVVFGRVVGSCRRVEPAGTTEGVGYAGYGPVPIINTSGVVGMLVFVRHTVGTEGARTV